VKTLRARQFPEDGGPLAHPVRPSSYIEINNFYTPTVYEKGAELCRMMKTLIGAEAFRKAMDLYFARHDGEAATVENFVKCMEDASGRNLDAFFAWYEQAGTPHVVAEGKYDSLAHTFTLDIEQSTAPTPGQDFKRPFHMPLALGLLSPKGDDMPLDLEGRGVLNNPVIELTGRKHRFVFRNVAQKPVLSLNRGFSAPVTLTANQSIADALFLMEKDGDPFNRWEAGQAIAKTLTLDHLKPGKPSNPSGYAKALAAVLKDQRLDQAFQAQMLGLPGEAEIAAAIGKEVDTDQVRGAREALRAAVGRALLPQLLEIWEITSESAAYLPDQAGTARRALRYAALQLIAAGNPAKGSELAAADLAKPASMTAEIGALTALVLMSGTAADAELQAFYDRHRSDHLLVDKWFALNAQVQGAGSAKRVADLTRHPDFKLTTPNRVYGLIGAFTSANPSGFNAADGEGYRVVADTIMALDPLNPQVAARIATGFRSWRMLSAPRREAAERELKRISGRAGLSRDTFEIVSRMLAA
jgi:aminopeptidase N